MYSKILFLSFIFVLSSCNIIESEESKMSGITLGSNNNEDQRNSNVSCASASNDPNSLSLTNSLVNFFHFEEPSGSRKGVTEALIRY